MNGSSPSVSTSRVRSGCSTAGSMWGWGGFSKTRKYRSSRTSTLDGWTSPGSYGSSLTRPDSISALMSRSERSTQESSLFLYGVWARTAELPPRAAHGTACGCSSMVEHQLPKLTVRVRFPSSALMQKARSEAVSEAWPFVCLRPERAAVPLGGHGHRGRDRRTAGWRAGQDPGQPGPEHQPRGADRQLSPAHHGRATNVG